MSQTPNLHLELPVQGALNWNDPINANFAAIDVAVTDIKTTANAAEVAANKGKVNGYASLDSSGLVPSTQIPNIAESKVTNLTTDLAAKAAKTYVDTQDTATLNSAKSYADSVVGGAGLTSVGLSTDASWFTIGSTPLTSNGTLAIARTNGLTANQVLATPNGTTGKVSPRLLVAADIPSLPASKINSGQVGLAAGGTNADLSTSGSATSILAQAADHTISARNLISADIPNLDASKISTGVIDPARVGVARLLLFL